MVIGVPKEIKDNEYRVGMTPGGVRQLVEAGHQVLVQRGAGEGSGFSDKEYEISGAEIVSTNADAWGAQMVVKVKEPQPSEYDLMRPDLILFAYLHLAANEGLTREMISTMNPGSVVVDVAVDQGGCVETTKPTTHSNPTFLVEGVIHYCVANIPGAVPRTSTYALSNATLPYVVKLAGMGAEAAIHADPSLAKGVNIYNGKIAYPAVAEALGPELTAQKIAIEK